MRKDALISLTKKYKTSFSAFGERIISDFLGESNYRIILRAMSAALRLLDVNKHKITKGKITGMTMIDYAVLAGSISGIDYALKIGVRFDHSSISLRMAAASGNRQVFDLVRDKIMSGDSGDTEIMGNQELCQYLA